MTFLDTYSWLYTWIGQTVGVYATNFVRGTFLASVPFFQKTVLRGEKGPKWVEKRIFRKIRLYSPITFAVFNFLPFWRKIQYTQFSFLQLWALDIFSISASFVLFLTPFLGKTIFFKKTIVPNWKTNFSESFFLAEFSSTRWGENFWVGEIFSKNPYIRCKMGKIGKNIVIWGGFVPYVLFRAFFHVNIIYSTRYAFFVRDTFS